MDELFLGWFAAVGIAKGERDVDEVNKINGAKSDNTRVWERGCRGCMLFEGKAGSVNFHQLWM